MQRKLKDKNHLWGQGQASLLMALPLLVDTIIAISVIYKAFANYGDFQRVFDAKLSNRCGSERKPCVCFTPQQ